VAAKKKAGAKKAAPGRAAPDPEAVFAVLKSILDRYEDRLHVASLQPNFYCLETKSASYNGKPMFFGAVRAGKAYVSFHLMPLYWEPSLAKGISPALKKRMQGKSCFNFTSYDPALVRQLAKLTAAGLALYRRKNLL
jgi:hypothetical protein